METPDDLLQEILVNSPSSRTLFLVLSLIKEQGNPQKVIDECKKALDTYPEDISIRKLLAESYYEVGQVSDAEAVLKETSELFSEFSPSYKLHAEILNAQNKKEEALRMLNLYLAHEPNDKDAVDLFNELSSSEKPVVHEEVDEDETDSASMTSSLPEIATPTLAEIYFDQGQIQEATGIYEKVIAKNPGDESSIKRLNELKEMTPVQEDISTEEEGVDSEKHKTEKFISILESWLGSIRENSKTSAPTV